MELSIVVFRGLGVKKKNPDWADDSKDIGARYALVYFMVKIVYHTGDITHFFILEEF